MLSSSVTSQGLRDFTVGQGQTPAKRISSQTSKQTVSQESSSSKSISKYEANAGVVVNFSSESKKMSQEDRVRTKAAPSQANSEPRQTLSIYA